jgi:hypothetical protein
MAMRIMLLRLVGMAAFDDAAAAANTAAITAAGAADGDTNGTNEMPAK